MSRSVHKLTWGIAVVLAIAGLLGYISPANAALLGLLVAGAGELFEE
jgi:hypothetical protein